MFGVSSAVESFEAVAVGISGEHLESENILCGRSSKVGEVNKLWLGTVRYSLVTEEVEYRMYPGYASGHFLKPPIFIGLFAIY